MQLDISAQHLAQSRAPTTDLAPPSLDPRCNGDMSIENLVEMSDAYVAELCTVLRSHGALPTEALLALCPLPAHLSSQDIDLTQLLILYSHYLSHDPSSTIISATDLALQMNSKSDPRASSSCQLLPTPATNASRKTTIQYSECEDQEAKCKEMEEDARDEEEEDEEWSSKILRPSRPCCPVQQAVQQAVQQPLPLARSHASYSRQDEVEEEDQEEGEGEGEEHFYDEGVDLIRQFAIQQQQLDQSAYSYQRDSYQPRSARTRPSFTYHKHTTTKPKPKPAQTPGAQRPANARALALDKEVLMLHEIDRPVAERMIRDKLGNNPDTSKSLRRLALEGKVVRHGVGGRGEPFRYELTQLGREIYRELMSERGRVGQ